MEAFGNRGGLEHLSASAAPVLGHLKLLEFLQL